MAWTGQDLWRPLDRPGKAVGEELLDCGPAFSGFEIALGRDGSVPADGQDMARIVEMGLQCRQPFVPLQHQEMRFWHPFGFGWVEAGGPVFDGVAAIGKQRLAGAQRGARQRFRGQAFDGIAVDTGDLRGWGRGHADMRPFRRFPIRVPPLSKS